MNPMLVGALRQPDGTWRPTYKNRIGDKISHKPRLLMQHGRWACISHNARGEGPTLTAAFENWQWQIDVNTARHRLQKAPYRNPGAAPSLWPTTDDL